MQDITSTRKRVLPFFLSLPTDACQGSKRWSVPILRSEGKNGQFPLPWLPALWDRGWVTQQAYGTPCNLTQSFLKLYSLLASHPSRRGKFPALSSPSFLRHKERFNLSLFPQYVNLLQSLRQALYKLICWLSLFNSGTPWNVLTVPSRGGYPLYSCIAQACSHSLGKTHSSCSHPKSSWRRSIINTSRGVTWSN